MKNLVGHLNFLFVWSSSVKVSSMNKISTFYVFPFLNLLVYTYISLSNNLLFLKTAAIRLACKVLVGTSNGSWIYKRIYDILWKLLKFITRLLQYSHTQFLDTFVSTWVRAILVRRWHLFGHTYHTHEGSSKGFKYSTTFFSGRENWGLLTFSTSINFFCIMWPHMIYTALKCVNM